MYLQNSGDQAGLARLNVPGGTIAAVGVAVLNRFPVALAEFSSVSRQSSIRIHS